MTDVQQSTLFAEPFTEGALLRHTATGSLWRVAPSAGQAYTELESVAGEIDGETAWSWPTYWLARDFEAVSEDA